MDREAFLKRVKQENENLEALTQVFRDWGNALEEQTKNTQKDKKVKNI